MARHAKTSLYVAALGSYAAVDPSANGSGYAFVPTIGPVTRTHAKAQLETNHAVGSVFPTAPEAGPDGGELSFKTYLGSFVASGGDGVAAPAADWLDTLLASAFGSNTTRSGEGVGASSTTTNLVMDTDVYSIQDVIPIYEAGLAPGRTQWTQVQVDPASGSYTVAPAFATAPTTAAVAYAVNQYRFADGGGVYVAAVMVDDNVGTYTLLGGRLMLRSIAAEHGGLYVADWSIRFDNRTLDVGKSSLPAITPGPAFRPLQAVRSPVNFAGTFYDTKRVQIDFAPAATIVGATSGINGRAGDELVAMMPKVTIEPLRASALEDLQRAATQGTLLVQLGGGVLSGGQLGTMAFLMDRAIVESTTDADDGGVSRNAITFRMADRAIFSGTTRAVPFQLVRA